MDDIPSCDGCGACCMQQGHPPYTEDELAGVPADLKSSIETYLATLESDDSGRPCLWLDLETRQCRHYEERPQICRDFERGSTNCTLLRWRYQITGAIVRESSPFLAEPPFLGAGNPVHELPVIETCDGCGACCMQQGHPPFTNDERDLLADDLLGPIDEHLKALVEDDFGQPCMWFDLESKQCGHYEDRPQVCRDFERGSAMCVQLRLRYKVS